MTPRSRRTAWIGGLLLAAGFLAIWFYPTEFEVGAYPGAGAATAEEPAIPTGVFGVAGLVIGLGLGLAWYLPWLGRRLARLPGRLVLGAVCVVLAVVGLGGVPAILAGVESAEQGAREFAVFLGLLGTGLVLWLVAGALGLVALFRRKG